MIYCFLDEWQFEPYHVSNNQSFHIQVSGWKKGWVWDDRNLNKDTFIWTFLLENLEIERFHVPRMKICVKYKSIKYLVTYSSPSRVFSTVCCRCKRHVRSLHLAAKRAPRVAGCTAMSGVDDCGAPSDQWVDWWRLNPSSGDKQKLPTFTKSLYALPETKIVPENRPFAPKGKNRLPTIHFQG